MERLKEIEAIAKQIYSSHGDGNHFTYRHAMELAIALDRNELLDNLDGRLSDIYGVLDEKLSRI